jgi:hypothetical protein
MGKCNIKLIKGKETSVLFAKEDLKLRLKVKDELLESIGQIKSEDESRRESKRLLCVPSSKLFVIEK